MQLGTQVRDRITGLTGTLTGMVEYISGCNQGLITPRIGMDGTLKESSWFDMQRLESIEGDRIVLDNGGTPGPDKAPPKI